MNPVGKALWFVESHFGSEITLDEIANVAGVSRFYMTRAFGDTTGHSIMRYVRGRRLTEAARALAGGAPDILAVALDSGYGSHEAFTRAFRDEFDLTPEAVRTQGHLSGVKLLEPIKMEETIKSCIPPMRFQNGKLLLIAGLVQRYTCETSGGIPSQWQRFQPHIGQIPGQLGPTAFGVRWNSDEHGAFDYLCGVEVTDFSRLPPDLTHVRIAAQKYAVFSHYEHVSTIRSTWTTIWNKWLPESGHELVDAPDFERYGAEFDPRTGTGGFEIWVPIKG
ncbi:MAG TPA: AraC family transcriptional regulator [Vicinamibacterales bacterium]|jgi:AraC family transcriptional regulator|nr:AraC family transcriptional regulator [Vicinamibacterales bacterium]